MRTETRKEEGCTRVSIVGGCTEGHSHSQPLFDNIHPRRIGRAAYFLIHMRALHSRGIMVVAAAVVVWTMPEMVVRGKKNAHDKSQSGSKSSKAEKRKSRLVFGDTPDSSSDRSYDDSMSGNHIILIPTLYKSLILNKCIILPLFTGLLSLFN
jgi:hypothetical protein